MAQIDSLEIRIAANATEAGKAIDRLSAKLNGLSKGLARTGLSSSALNNIGTGATRINNRFTTLSKSVKASTVSFKSLTNSLTGTYMKFRALTQSVKELWSAVEKSMNYIETLNYFNAAFGQVAEKADLSMWSSLGYESAEAYANSFSERALQLTQKMTGFAVSDNGSLASTGGISLGIDPNQVMQYQAMFGQMASSIGITSENSLKLSNALTMIGADLASVKNMDFDKVWTDMASGLAGMSRTLDKYGVNIRNVNLQQKLTELGINANITALNQNEKALLRTIILLDSTTYAQGDLARTLEQPANQVRLLTSNMSNLARTIGNLFLPIVANVLLLRPSQPDFQLI